MAQFVRPIADIDGGSWSTTPFWSKIDEDIGGGGDDVVVTSEVVGNNTNTSDLDLEGTNTGIDDPAVSTGHILRVLWASSSVRDIIGHFELWQGVPDVGTLIAEATVSILDATEVTTTHTLTGTEADNITDYNDLHFALWGRGLGGGPDRALVVDAAELEIPDAGGDATATPAAVQATVTIDQPALTASAQAEPAAIQANVTIDAPALFADATAVLTAIGAIVTMPSVTAVATGDATATLTAIAAVVTIPGFPDRVIIPPTVQATVTLDQPFASAGDAIAVLTAIGAVVTIDQPVTTTSAQAEPGAIGVVATFPTVVTTTSAQAEPLAVQATVTIDTVVTTTSATIVATAVQAIVTMPGVAATGGVGATATLTAIAAIVTIDTPTTTTSATILATAVNVVVTMPAVAALTAGDATVVLTAVQATVTIDTVVTTTSATIVATAIQANVTIDAPVVFGGVTVTLTAIQANVSIDTVTTTTSATAIATAIQANVTVDQVVTTTSATVVATAINAIVTMPGVTATTSTDATAVLTAIVAVVTIDPIRGSASVNLTERSLRVPGVVGNNVRTPSVAALQITGDIDLRGDWIQTPWLSGNHSPIIGKAASDATMGYELAYGFDERFRMQWHDGTSFQSISSIPHVPADFKRTRVRATLDVDNGASGHDVKFYLSESALGEIDNWVQLGSTITTAGVTQLTAESNDLEVGADRNGGRANWFGRVFAAQVYAGIDGTLIADFNAFDFNVNDTDTDTGVDSTGKTWTIFGTSSVILGKGQVTVSIPTVTTTTSATAVLTAITATVTIDTVATTTSATALPSSVNVVASLPAVVAQGGVTVTLTAINAVVTIDAPTIGIGADIALVAIAANVSIDTVTTTTSATLTTTAIAAVVTIPAPFAFVEPATVLIPPLTAEIHGDDGRSFGALSDRGNAIAHVADDSGEAQVDVSDGAITRVDRI